MDRKWGTYAAMMVLAAAAMGSWSALPKATLPDIATPPESVDPRQSFNFGPPAVLNGTAYVDNPFEEFATDVVRDAAGTWVMVGVWGDPAMGYDWDTYVCRSTDGVTWSAPTYLSSFSGGGAHRNNARLATDGRGTWMAYWGDGFAVSPDGGLTWTDGSVWSPESAPALRNCPVITATAPGTWLAACRNGWADSPSGITVFRSTDNGVTWSAVASVSDLTSPRTLHYPNDMVTDGQGTVLMILSKEEPMWYGHLYETSWPILLRSTDGGLTWGAPVTLMSTGWSLTPMDCRLAGDGKGHWFAYWTIQQRQIDPHDYFSMSRDNGLTWSAPSTFAPVEPGQREWKLEFLPAGGSVWLAAWQGCAGVSSVFVSRSEDDGLTWGPGTLVFGGPAYETQLAGDGSGRCHLYFSRRGNAMEGYERDLLEMRSEDGGLTWTAPRAVFDESFTDVGQDIEPSAVASPTGTWICAWASSYNLYVGDACIESDFDILFARSTDRGLSWSYPQPLSSSAFGDTLHDQVPQLATDGQGRWVAVWQTSLSRHGASGPYPILASRSLDDGLTWSEPVPVATGVARPQVVAAGNGHWVTLLCADLPFSDCWEVRASHSADDGLTWDTPTPLGLGVDPCFASDGAGRIVAVWNPQIRCSPVPGLRDNTFPIVCSVDGGASWLPAANLDEAYLEGVRSDDYPDVASDGNGGWTLVWSRTRDCPNDPAVAPDADIFCARSHDGLSWSAPRAINAYADSDNIKGPDWRQDGSAHLFHCGDGRLLVQWTRAGGYEYIETKSAEKEWIPDSRTEVTVAARSLDGGVSWGPDKGFLSPDTVIAPDGLGGWLAVWNTNAGQSEYLSGLGSDGDIMYRVSWTDLNWPDVDLSGGIDAVDVQIVINGCLSLAVPATVSVDTNSDGFVNAMDVQIVVNAVLAR